MKKLWSFLSVRKKFWLLPIFIFSFIVTGLFAFVTHEEERDVFGIVLIAR